jgi:hypothetical protein
MGVGHAAGKRHSAGGEQQSEEERFDLHAAMYRNAASGAL